MTDGSEQTRRGDGRSPHGERGLKSEFVVSGMQDRSRSPHGERGLKSVGLRPRAHLGLSLPAWGAWIEIGLCLW